MIALETSTKIGKSPKKPKVVTHMESDTDESGEDSDVESVDDVEEDNVETADEGDVQMESASERETDSGEEADKSDGNEETSGSDGSQNEDKSKANPGWADAMRKILQAKKPKRKKTIVLSKAKKLCDVVPKEKKEGLGFEVDGEIGEAKAEASEPLDRLEMLKEKEADHGRRKRREVDFGIRTKPSVLERERERALQKIATKGVVQLFNAVRQQQKDIGKQLEEAGPLERKREKVLQSIDKRAFLDVLMGGSKSIQVDGAVKVEKQEKLQKEEKTWDVLRDDFMMGAKLKDWDKKKQEDEDSSAPEDMDSDD